MNRHKANQALQEFRKLAPAERSTRIVIQASPGHGWLDVTEDVITLMDQVSDGCEWQSGYYQDDDVTSFIKLAGMLSPKAEGS